MCRAYVSCNQDFPQVIELVQILTHGRSKDGGDGILAVNTVPLQWSRIIVHVNRSASQWVIIKMVYNYAFQNFIHVLGLVVYWTVFNTEIVPNSNLFLSHLSHELKLNYCTICFV